MSIHSHNSGRAVLIGRCLLLAFASILVAAPRGRSADLAVLTAGAFKPVLLDLAPAFEAKARVTLVISNDTSGAVTARVLRGEAIDLVILPPAALDTLVAQGKVIAGSVTQVAKSGIGAVVKQGEPVPDIDSVEAFRQTLLAVRSLAYIDPASGGSSGIYLAGLFDRLGIAEAIKRKTVLVPGGLVGSRVANGEAALGLQQISELRAVSGVTYVGPLPAAIQNYTIYAGGIPTAAKSPAAGQALLAELRSEAAMRALTARGLEPP